jgi:DNA-binding response OmpR family regulator
MLRIAELPATVLFIDANDADRTFFVEGQKRDSPDYLIREAIDGESGLNLYRSQRVDCVVLALGLPERSGFRLLVELVPIASRSSIAVLMLTSNAQRGRSLILSASSLNLFCRAFFGGILLSFISC